jgi:hypothetical protein
MLNTTSKKNQIEKIILKNYQLDFGNVFEDAIDNYKKIALYAGLMFLIFSVIASFVMICVGTAYIGLENLEEFGIKINQLSNMKVMPFDIALPLNSVILLVSALISPFMAGFLKMAQNGQEGEEFHVSTMFSYYKSTYFLNIFLAVILIGITSTTFVLLFDASGIRFVGSLISFVISLLSYLMIPLIVFGNLNAADAIKYSTLLVLKQPIIFLGLIIVAFIGSILGIFAFCFGMFFTFPFVYSMQYAIYKNIIGFEEKDEINDISGAEN